MKSLLKVAAFAALVVTFAACDESPVKSDYDPVFDENNLPTGVVAYDADVYLNKVRVTGKIDANQTLSDCGLVYCIDTLVDKYGSLEDALLNGVINSKYVISLMDAEDLEHIEVIIDELQPKHEYYYALYACNQNGVVFSDPMLFTTTGVAAPLIDLSASSSQTSWEKPFVFVDKDGDGENFEFTTLDGKNGLCSYSWKTGKVYKPDNLIVTSGLDLGFDMNIDYQIYPQGKGKSTYADKFALLISTDSITADNCDKAVVLDSLRFTEEYREDSVRAIVKTLPIPAEYEFTKVWFAVRHFDCTNKSGVFVETLKVY